MNAYDFDDTIYAGDSSLHFFLFFLKKDLSLIKYLPTVLSILRDYHKEKIRFDDIIDTFGHIFEDYCVNKKLDFEKISKEFWDKNEHRIKPFYKEIQKEDDLLITASPDFLIKEICERIGINHYLATEFDPKTGKFLRGCFREKKIDFFLEAYPDGKIDDFYTDSMNDKFLFPYSKRVFLVDGNKITQYK